MHCKSLMLFVVYCNEFLDHLEINLIVKKSMEMQQLSSSGYDSFSSLHVIMNT